MCLIFVGQGYPRKLFNLEHFLIYGSYKAVRTSNFAKLKYHQIQLLDKVPNNIIILTKISTYMVSNHFCDNIKSAHQKIRSYKSSIICYEFKIIA